MTWLNLSVPLPYPFKFLDVAWEWDLLTSYMDMGPEDNHVETGMITTIKNPNSRPDLIPLESCARLSKKKIYEKHWKIGKKKRPHLYKFSLF